MKHIKGFLALSAVMMLSSCITITKTARTAETSSSIQNATVADLKVSDHRVTYTMTPSKEIQRAGLSNVYDRPSEKPRVGECPPVAPECEPWWVVRPAPVLPL